VEKEMKIDIPRTLVEEATEQLAAMRGCVDRPLEWDQSALGKLYSMFVQETSGRSRVSKKRSTAVSNRRKASSRFKR
jgi:hypothetical protein